MDIEISLVRPLRHAARRLVRARSFSAAVVTTLALGLGATTTVFTVVNAVLLRPLPYPEPDRLVSLSHTLVVGGTLRVDQSDATLLFYHRHNSTFAHLGGYQASAAGLAPIGASDAERVAAGRVTADLFPALGVAPLRGRLFTDADDRPAAPPVVILAERLWARKFARDPGIVNSRIAIDGVPHEIVGILPAAVRIPAPDTELWVPLRLDPAKTDSASFDYQGLARLRDGVTIEAATADLQALLPRLPEEFPGRMTRESIALTHTQPSVRPLAAVVVGDVSRLLWVVFGVAGFVMAIACANVANLFLVRAETRREALALLRAIGASTGAVLLEFLCEGLLVSIAGATLGIGAAVAALRWLRTVETAIDIPRLAEVTVDGTVVALATALAVIAALLVSAVPALRWSAAAISGGAGGRSTTAGRDRHRVRHALVVSQVGLALVLLVGAGLMARSVSRLRSVPPGFESTGTFMFRMALPPVRYPGADESVRFFTRAADTIAAVPGVRAAGVVSKVPLDETGRTDTAVFVEDRPMAPGALPGLHPIVYATPDYFSAAGIRLVEGRSFTPPDPPRVALEAVVSRAFAERYWKGDSPIGKRVRILVGGPWYTVVGVVSNVRDRALDRPVDQLIYCPLLPAREDKRWAPRDMAFVVRADADPAAITRLVREAVRGLDPSLPVYRLTSFSDLVAHAEVRRSLTLFLISCASGIALLLGAIGLYSVLSYVVTLRTREIGIRLALGAQPRELRRRISRQGLSVAAVGIAVGLVGAVALSRVLASLLFEVSPTDPLVFAGSAMFLLVVAGAASWLPARRAAAIEPAAALRAE
ncbi:MAG TPA: ABC transporter permease [Vicinamibacterales bacterium]|nr:ABC transporter permease [Vicinamibacterales bacterium]